MLPFLDTTDEVLDWLAGDGARIVGVLLVAIIIDFAIRRGVPHAVEIPVRRGMRGVDESEIEQRIETLAGVFTTGGRVLIILIAALTLLPLAGISVGPLLAGAGIVGIAVGFGAQSLVKDVISGFFILLDNQYSEGDVVTIAGVTGIVEDVGLRRTMLRDLDGVVHYVPNGQIEVGSNLTQEYSGMNLDIGVSYSEDLDHVMSVINRVGKEMAEDPVIGEALLEAPYCLRVNNFGDSGIDIKVLGNTKPLRQWEMMGELRRRVKKAFDEEGIEIPYPHRTLVTKGSKAWDLPRAKTKGQEPTAGRPPADEPQAEREQPAPQRQPPDGE